MNLVLQVRTSILFFCLVFSFGMAGRPSFTLPASKHGRGGKSVTYLSRTLQKQSHSEPKEEQQLLEPDQWPQDDDAKVFHLPLPEEDPKTMYWK